MLGTILSALLDIIVIVTMMVAIFYGIRIDRQLKALRASRQEMERFVHEFGATVTRAEGGIKNLKLAARESGDDLEKMIAKASTMRDELQFVIEHADQRAEKLSTISAARATAMPEMRQESSEQPVVKSRAEKELLRAIDKLR